MPSVLNAEGYGAMSADVLALLKVEGNRILKAAQAEVEQRGVPVDSLLLDILDGSLCEQVAGQAKAWPADLVVLGTHGRRGVQRLLIGSDAEQVLRASHWQTGRATKARAIGSRGPCRSTRSKPGWRSSQVAATGRPRPGCNRSLFRHAV
jgi:hypothetical protein